MTETFYDVLGVSPDASESEIEDAYRERIKETHPDLNDAEDAEDETQRVIEARDVLTDEAERAEYDSMGHEAYVVDGTGGVDEADVGAAARAAREAGWADADKSGSSESTAAGTNAGRYERRRREREASERVRSDRSTRASGRGASGSSGRASNSASSARAGRSSGRTGATGATTDGGAGTVNGRRRGSQQRNYDASAWNSNTEYSVRREYDTGVTFRDLIPRGQSLSLLGIAFVLYPIMLFSSLFPAFPLIVNVVVGFCTLFLIGYLQSQPSIGVLVFGGWSVLIPVVLYGLGVSFTGLVGVIAIAGAVFPLLFSLLTLWMLQF